MKKKMADKGAGQGLALGQERIRNRNVRLDVACLHLQ